MGGGGAVGRSVALEKWFVACECSQEEHEQGYLTVMFLRGNVLTVICLRVSL